MLFESRHITVTADHGTATLAFGFGGEPANALGLASLRELDGAIRAVASSPSITTLVLRSSIPKAFCSGLQPLALASLTHPADRSTFAWYGQQAFARLARLEAVSIAYIDGPCLSAGLELALACDYRLCVASSTTVLGFPDRFACFGGTAHLYHLAGRRGLDLLASGQTLSGRECVRLGLVDTACCERRSKIALQSFLDRVEARPIKPPRSLLPDCLAAERRAFAMKTHAVKESSFSHQTINPIPPFSNTVGLLGNNPFVDRLAAEIVLRGGSAVVCGDRSGIFAGITTATARGFITPLEAEQAWQRVRVSDTLAGFDRAGLVFVADGQRPFRAAATLTPRAVVCVVRAAGGESLNAARDLAVPFPYPRRLLRISFDDSNRMAIFPDSSTDTDTIATLAAWMRPFGVSSVVFPVESRLLPRAA